VAQPQRSILPDSVGPRFERRNAAECSARGAGSTKSENFVKASLVEGGINLSCSKDRFDLRSEVEVTVPLRIEKRSYSKSIARHEHCFAISIVDREGELAVESSQKIRAPLFVTMNEDLRVTASSEYVSPALQLSTQLGVVVHLTRGRRYDLSIFVRQRLASASDIGYTQSDMGQTDSAA
jgi:hypothetical protein